MSCGLVSLIGLPGAGKSTVGRQLAKKLHCVFSDSDAEIERRIGCEVTQFFALKGESSFRDIEEQVISELAEKGGVLSTGGGAVLREANRRTLRACSRVVYLHATPADLYRRLRHDTQRPLLQVADPLQKLHDLFAARDPLYRETAHCVIETGRPSVATLVNMLLKELDIDNRLRP